MTVIPRVKSLVPKPIKRAIKSRFGFQSSDGSSQLKIDRFGPFDMAYRVGTVDEAVLTDSFENDIFFRGVPEYRPLATDIILDVGAHIGTFAVLAAAQAPQGKVYAVEACKDTFNYLRINVALNGLTNVQTSHLALSDREGKTTLHYDDGNWGHSIVKKLSRHGEIVTTDTLANFMHQNGIEKCDFAKFNCEGAEFPILLASSPETIARFKMMLVLYHCDLATGHSYQELLRHFDVSGFDTTLRNQSDQRGWIIATRRNLN